MVTIALAGDTMLGRNVADVLAEDPGARLVAEDVAAVMRGADLCLVNLECCVSAGGARWDADPHKPFFFRAPPAAAGVLADLGVDAVTLANNHALDYGPEALLDTCRHLDEAGVAWVGAGRDRDTARRPLVLDVAGLRVGVVAASDHPRDFAAGDRTPGIALWEHRHEDWTTAVVAALAPEVDLLIATVHWGPNMVPAPSATIETAAHNLVAAGADLVAGHSAHVFHGVQWQQRAGQAIPVLFDLGDFLDDYAVHPQLRNDLGLLWLVTLDGATVSEVAALPLYLDTCFTERAVGDDRDWIAGRLARASAAFDTEVDDDGDRLVVRVPAPAGTG